MLQTSKKGSSTCSQFIQQIQSIADRLRSIGSDISDQDLVLYTLQGLGLEYESFVIAFSMQQSNVTMLDLQPSIFIPTKALSLRHSMHLNNHPSIFNLKKTLKVTISLTNINLTEVVATLEDMVMVDTKAL
jgi:gag-polypeptide of LTR copia-type